MLQRGTNIAGAQPSHSGQSAVPKVRRSRTTNNPFARFSRNTATGRRIADLASGFIEALGNPTDVTIICDCVAAAELKVIAEQARERALRDRSIDYESISRLEGAADRAVRRLNIERKAPGDGMTVEQYAALVRERRT